MTSHRIVLVSLIVVCFASVVLAQDVVYTGCIKSGDGSLYSVRAGTAPMSPCKAKDKQISWNMAGQPGPAGPSLPRKLEVNVNCDEGQSINAALAQQAERLTILISGTCVEHVYINRDDVTIRGVGTNPTITATADHGDALQISGAQRVVLQGFALTGSTGTALYASDGASFTAYELKISNPGGSGLDITNGVAAVMQDSEIAGNGAHGAGVGWGSSLFLSNTQIIDNGGFGVFVQASALTLWGTTNVAGNGGEGVFVRNGRVVGQFGCTILDNDSGGVSLLASHLFLEQCRIAGNSSLGLGLSGGSAAMLRDVIIQGNENGGVSAVGGSSVEVQGASTIEGGTERNGINLRDTSVADVSGQSSITGSPFGIECAPPPSVAQLTWAVPATVTTNCPMP